MIKMYAKRKRRTVPCGGNEENSPGFFVAFKDPYSSDDEKLTKHMKKDDLDKTAPKDVKQPTPVLFKKHSASSMKAEHVHYFLNVNFDAMIHEVPLETTNVETCLAVLFQFITGKDTNDIQTNSDFCYNNKTMKDLTKFYLSKEDIRWLYKNDNLYYKLATIEDINKKKDFLTSCNDKLDFEFKDSQRYALSICNLCSRLSVETMKRNEQQLLRNTVNCQSKWQELNSQSTNLTKLFLQTLALLLKYEDYKHNEQSINWFPLRVRPDDVSEGSLLIEDRLVQILTIPDGIFTVPVKAKPLLRSQSNFNNYLSRVVVEIYKPIDDVVLEASSDQDLPYVITDLPKTIDIKDDIDSKLNQKCRVIEKPKRRGQDCISDAKYCADVRKWIQQSLPKQCCTADMVDKMAGHHVMQLFYQAFHNKIVSKLLKNDTEASENKFHTVFGMFLVNEHIYFSRLLVNDCILGLINGFEYTGSMTDNEGLKITFDSIYNNIEPPCVAYAPFRLDITEPSHRHALVIFMREYLYNYSLIK